LVETAHICVIEKRRFMPEKTDKIAVIILAAGASTRLGQPKQLIVFEEITLLERAIKAAFFVTKNIVVVVGFEAEKMILAHEHLPVSWVKNVDWATGMASSIRAGLVFAQTQFVDCQGIIYAVCDQPRLDGAIFQKIISKKTISSKSIIASKYATDWGVPMYFSKNYFSELLQLNGAAGAKKVAALHLTDLAKIDFWAGDFDIDVLEDLARL
jgi:molybdenum cofactor cytidylyltransferase